MFYALPNGQPIPNLPKGEHHRPPIYVTLFSCLGKQEVGVDCWDLERYKKIRYSRNKGRTARGRGLGGFGCNLVSSQCFFKLFSYAFYLQACVRKGLIGQSILRSSEVS